MKLAAKRAREQETTEGVDEPQVTQEQEEPPIVSPALKRMKTGELVNHDQTYVENTQLVKVHLLTHFSTYT